MVDLTDAGFEAAEARGREMMKSEPRAVAAHYDRETGRVAVELTNGCTFIFPATLAQELHGADDEALSRIVVDGAGFNLHWPAIDADLYVPALVAGVFGTRDWMAKALTTPWDAATHLETVDDIAAYLKAAFQDGDPQLIAAALGDVARSAGMTQVTSMSGVARESLYEALSSESNQALDTLFKLIRWLGLRITPARSAEELPMLRAVNIADAETQFAHLLALAEQHHQVFIERDGRITARIAPVDTLILETIESIKRERAGQPPVSAAEIRAAKEEGRA